MHIRIKTNFIIQTLKGRQIYIMLSNVLMLIFRYFASQETRKANLLEQYPKLKLS
jgi:hypothetical protein